jgi:hypothetical protein
MCSRSLGRNVLTLVGLASLAACSDNTAPEPGKFNSARVEAGVAAVERAAASPVLGSLQAVARVAGDARTVPTTEPFSGLESAIQRLSAATTAGAALVPLMRESVLGKTFTYNPTSHTYAPDASRTGAPANGVRFVLYETAAAGDPIAGREIGYADLTDERRASPATAGVRLVIVTGGVTRLDYSFDLSGSQSSAAFDVHGFLSDGNDRVNFAINTNSQLFGRGGKATLDATLTVPSHDFVVMAMADGIAGTTNGDGKVDLTIHSGADELIVEAETTEGQLDASVSANGKLLATATGNPSSPVIRGQAGRELLSDELRAVGAVIDMSGAIFQFVSDLLRPAGLLLLLALGVGG